MVNLRKFLDLISANYNIPTAGEANCQKWDQAENAFQVIDQIPNLAAFFCSPQI